MSDIASVEENLSAQPQKPINLFKQLLPVISANLPPDQYYELKVVFGLDGNSSSEMIHNEIKDTFKKVGTKKKFESIIENLQVMLLPVKPEETGYRAEIAQEVQLLKDTLSDFKNFTDNFNTEENLLKLVAQRYKIGKLKDAQIGLALLLFFVYDYESIAIPNCKPFWKLTKDGDKITISDLEKLDKICFEVLDNNNIPMDYKTLSDSIYKANNREYTSEALLRFILAADKRIERLKTDFFQIYFHKLNDDKHPYRILYEKNREMQSRDIDQEIYRRLSKVGLSSPRTNAVDYLSTRPWYVDGVKGWGLAEWGGGKKDIPDILEEWFRQTESPVTLKEMVTYIRKVRADLSVTNVESKLNSYISNGILRVYEAVQGRKTERFYHNELPDPKGFTRKKLELPAKKTKTTTPKKFPTLFVSYSHSDEKWRKAFHEHLKLLHEKHLMIWDDTQLEVGKPWDRQIKDALSSADAALFLVTRTFLTSDYINNKELPSFLRRAKKNGTPIYWVLVEPCLFEESPLAALQSVYSVKEDLYSLSRSAQQDAIVEICRKIRNELANKSA
jgi:hypothetical protein